MAITELKKNLFWICKFLDLFERSIEIISLSFSFLAKPSLVRETSRISVFELFRHPIASFKKMQKKPENILEGVILNPKVEERVR